MNIEVRRYLNQDDPSFIWYASVRPEDGEWVLFVPKDASAASPQLWKRAASGDYEPA